MLRFYSLYQKLETHIDKKFEEYSSENFWNIIKIIIPFASTLHYRINGNSIGVFAVILYIIFFIISFKYVRNKINNNLSNFKKFIRKIKNTLWGQDIDFTEEDIKQKKEQFINDSKNILKNLLFIYNLYPKKNNMKFFYIITILDDMEYYYKNFIEIKNITDKDDIEIYNNINKCIELYNYIIEQIEQDNKIFKDDYENKIYKDLINFKIKS